MYLHLEQLVFKIFMVRLSLPQLLQQAGQLQQAAERDTIDLQGQAHFLYPHLVQLMGRFRISLSLAVVAEQTVTVVAVVVALVVCKPELLP
jgi:ubiquinone biosynthesis protein UbiJ